MTSAKQNHRKSKKLFF